MSYTKPIRSMVMSTEHIIVTAELRRQCYDETHDEYYAGDIIETRTYEAFYEPAAKTQARKAKPSFAKRIARKAMAEIESGKPISWRLSFFRAKVVKASKIPPYLVVSDRRREKAKKE